MKSGKIMLLLSGLLWGFLAIYTAVTEGFDYHYVLLSLLSFGWSFEL